MPNLPDDTVIATFEDGTKFSMGEFRRLYGALNAQQQQSVIRDRGEFLHQYAMLRKMSKMADANKLDQQSPYKEALEQNRMQVLSQATINETLNSFIVEPGDILKSYEANKSKYTQVKVKAIYISYSEAAPSTTAKGKKP